MLARANRMVSSTEFATTVRRGRRTGRPSLVLHSRVEAGDAAGVRVGFVVSKAVGDSVTRHRVQRRLRHLVAEHLPSAPTGLRVVVRALPAAAVQPSRLAADLGGAWTTAAVGWVREAGPRS